MNPPIRVLDYFVEKFDYEVNRPDRLEDGVEAKNHVALRCEWNLVSHDADEGDSENPSDEHLVVRITVHLNTSNDSRRSAPFHATLRLAGMFARLPFDKLEQPPSSSTDYLKHSVASAISTLYGAAREVMASFTASTPHPKVMLPSISPYPVASSMIDDSLASTQGKDKSD